MSAQRAAPVPIRLVARVDAALFLALVVLLGSVSPAAATAADTIRSFYDVLLNTMQNGPSLGGEGRYRQLEPVIGQTFDLPYMTRLAVGPSWAGISEEKQQQVISAFGRYIAATYADRFTSYSGQQLQVTGEESHASDVIVESRIVRADGSPPVAIRYLMHQIGGADWRVADVYLEGTISELATRRSEFSTILQQQGIDGLIATLNQKAKLLVGSAAR
jgi:phospholipid transport system substrate-binding protein